MSVKHTIQKIKVKLKQINPNVKILSNYYKNNMTKMDCECLVCGHKWKAGWNTLRDGIGCPPCGKKKQAISCRKPTETLLTQLREAHPTLIFEEQDWKDCTRNTEPHKATCKVCGNIFERPYHHFINLKMGCNSEYCIEQNRIKCGRKYAPKEVIKQLKSNDKIEFPNIEKEYYNTSSWLTAVCKECGHTWQTTAVRVYFDNTGCRLCANEKLAHIHQSKPELELLNTLKELYPDEEFLTGRYGILGGREIDIYLPKYKLGIEFNGTYYHSVEKLAERGYDENYHLEKTKLALSKGINLLHIFEWEWETNHKEIISLIKDYIDYYPDNPPLELGQKYYHIHHYPFLLNKSNIDISEPELMPTNNYNCGTATLDELSWIDIDLQSFFENNNIKYKRLGNTYSLVEDNIEVLSVSIFYVIEFLNQDYTQKEIYNLSKVKQNQIYIFENLFQQEHYRKVLYSNILHKLNKTKNRFYARDLELKITDISENIKQFFNDNSMFKYKSAKTCFSLRNKDNEIIMAYLISNSRTGEHSAEIVRGAVKLNSTVVGGASKLWKAIIEYYKEHNLDDTKGQLKDIVYYVDRNIQTGTSMKHLEGLKQVNSSRGRWLYYLYDKYTSSVPIYKEQEVNQNILDGICYKIFNAGTLKFVYNF